MISRPGKSKKDRGYVLIDVLITLMILSIVMTSILGGYALVGNIAGGSWNRIKQLIQDRNEFDKIERIPE
jgi:Tfp pilus assembly protein PilV